MALDFPNSPTIGDEFTGGGFTWVWTGSTWSKVVAAVGGSNDFALLVGNTGNTTYVLDRTYTSGRYTIDFVNDDTTYDIYFVAENGTYAGYTNGTVAEVSADFTEVVVLGAASGETILFNYDGTLTSPSSAGDVPVAGAFLSATSESSLPDIDDFTILTGGNFAADVAVAFIGQNEVAVAAKTVTRSSSTELLATRPDAFPVAQSPYSVRVLNPGIPAPTGSNAHILSNAINAGTNPVWVTGADIFYNVGGATSITLVATDTEESDIDYALVSGTLPAGLTLDGPTGVISGTFSGTATEGDVTAITVRATDAGGNFVDKAFNLTANEAPTWTTPVGELDPAPIEGDAYSLQLVASTGTVGGALTYSLQGGALLPGLTLSSTGLISGTPTGVADDTATFTVRVTDDGGLFVDRDFSSTIDPATVSVEYLVIAGGGGGATGYGGAGGAGGYRSSVTGESSGGGSSAESALVLQPGVSYSVTVGAGGTGGASQFDLAGQGSGSTFHTITSNGGGRGGRAVDGDGQGGNGGSGGGSSANFGPNFAGGVGTAGQGFAGGGFGYGTGGGAGAAGSTSVYGTGVSSSITGSAVGRAGGGSSQSSSTGAGNPDGGGVWPAGAGVQNKGGGGASGNTSSPTYGPGATGGSGVVILRYPANHSITTSGLSASTITVGQNKVTTITSGTGNVSW